MHDGQKRDEGSLTIKGKALALIDTVILIDEELEVVVGIIDGTDLILVVDEVS